MKIQIIAIGDEILNGQIVNTNASWIAEKMTSLGYYVSKMEVIPDEYEAILKFVKDSFQKYDLTIVTGGLGPTKDDITKKVFKDYFSCEWKQDQSTLERIRSSFEKRGLPMLEVNEQQAFVPEVATVLKNNFGTAPGMAFEQDEKWMIALPGVPHEMKGILEEVGFDFIKEKLGGQSYYSFNVLTSGIGESFLAEEIKEWEADLRNDGLELAYLPSIGTLRLRITSKLSTEKDISLINSYVEKLKRLIPNYIYGYNDDTLSGVVGKLLKDRKLTISFMESCTGGGLANEFIKTSGSSAYVKGGLVTYTDEVKNRIGNVPKEIIDTYTVYSEECAMSMAEQVSNIFNSDIGIGVTGMLERENNESTFAYISICYRGYKQVVHKKFGQNRERNIQLCIFAVLNFLRILLHEDRIQ